MKHLPLAVTAAAAVAMLGLPRPRPRPARPARRAPAPPSPARRAATTTPRWLCGRAAAAERAARDEALAARDDRASQQHMSRFYAAVGRGLARNCYLGHPATGVARR